MRYAKTIGVVLVAAIVLSACLIPLSEIPALLGGSSITAALLASPAWPSGLTDPEGLFVWNDVLVFSAYRPDVGRELFAFDGSQTFLLADINPGEDSSDPNGFIEFYDSSYDDALYFGATTPGHGEELWRYSNGTAEMVADLYPGPSSALNGLEAIVFEGYLFLQASTATYSRELFYYAPSFSEPTLRDRLNVGGSGFPSDFEILDGRLYFYGQKTDIDGELFVKSNYGNNADYAASRLGTNILPQYLTAYDGMLYFQGDAEPLGGNLGDKELWVYDPGAGGGSNTRGSAVTDFGAAGSNVSDLFVYDGMLFFDGDDGTQSELYMYDGDELMSVDVNGEAGSSFPGSFAEYNDLLVFNATSATTGRELWFYDGRSARLAVDILPGPAGGDPDEMVVFDNRLFFTGYTDETETERGLYTLQLGADPEPEDPEEPGGGDLR